jgi:hypothetical protein
VPTSISRGGEAVGVKMTMSGGVGGFLIGPSSATISTYFLLSR